MTSFTPLVGYVVLFTILSIAFLLITLLIGKLVRPNLPNPEKTAIYECGEPTIGSSWVQFDLRFYVVALLFVVFDVEVAFFFPWAAVFGKATQVADTSAPVERIQQRLKELDPRYEMNEVTAETLASTQNAAASLARIAFVDLLVFFGVVLVGFAYLWKRGDLDWVRSTTAEAETESGSSWSETEAKSGEVPTREAATV